MVYRKGISEKSKCLAYVLREQGYSYNEIALKCKISKASAIRYSKTDPMKGSKPNPKVKRGRPRKLTERDRRQLLRSIVQLREKDVNFTIKKLVHFAGMNFTNVSYRTYARFLNEENFAFRQTRKKGVLSCGDKQKRLAFAKKCKIILKGNKNFFSQSVKLYLDGVSFVHKTNPLGEAMRPKARVWRKPGEGLDITSKGSKDLAGGKRLHLMVGIAYNKGVVLAEPYEHMDSKYFTQFVYNDLHRTFENLEIENPRMFIMDNDPSQSSKSSMDAIDDIGAEMFTIPPRSPYINVIENLFAYFKKKLQNDAKDNNITKESFHAFEDRVLTTLKTTDIRFVNSLIDSFPRRVEAIIERKGGRTKY